jgi:ketosteroid isomerase-like protein
MELPAEVDGTLDALLFRLRVDQRATRRDDEASARRELRSQPDAADLSRRLLLADAVRACLERAVASKERALLSTEAREAAARAALQAACRPDTVVQLAWREADEWQRRAREAEEAQRQALSLLAAAAAAPLPLTAGGDGRDAFTPGGPTHDDGAAVQARITAQLHATQRALAAAEEELQQQSALVRVRPLPVSS